MVTYEVTARVEPELVAEYERYMKEKHLRDVLASGCFVDATLERASDGAYRVRYRAKSQSDLDRYLHEHTKALREDFLRHFPKGVELMRDAWTELAVEKSRRG